MEEDKEKFIEAVGLTEVEEEINVFSSYYKPLAARTRKRQWRELASLRAFLLDRGLALGNLASDPSSWSKISGDHIWAYVTHLEEQHYTASSIAMQLHTIKTYARLAMEDKKLPFDEYIQIQNVQARPDAEQKIRRGEKRGEYYDLTDEQVQQLLAQPATQRGYRDKLLLALLLLCGLWPREIAALDRHSLDLEKGEITFYDYSSEEQQTIILDNITLEAARDYLRFPSQHEALFVGNRKDSTHTLRLTDRAINDRVRTLGEKINLQSLAPQDCHAYWEKSLREKRDEAHHSGARQSQRRKQRPDIFNRQAFEGSMRQEGVVDSMLAPFVSDSRLILPWMIQFICKDESSKQGFLKYIQQKLQEFGLKPNNGQFYEELLDHLAHWMDSELQKYYHSRQKED